MRPPERDLLDATPFACNLPEPSAQPEPITPPQGPRWKITPITRGFTLLAGGIALAFAPALSAAQIAAMLLGVTGLGLVAGAFRQRSRGLIFVALPLTALT